MKKTLTFFFILNLSILLQACASNSPQEAPLSKDAQIIQQLQASGKDLSIERNIDFFLYFPKQVDAEKAAQKLEQEGYRIDLSKDDFKKMWLVLATSKIMPNESTLSQLRQKFESITGKAGGKYLDWGTPMAE